MQNLSPKTVSIRCTEDGRDNITTAIAKNLRANLEILVETSQRDFEQLQELANDLNDGHTEKHFRFDFVDDRHCTVRPLSYAAMRLVEQCNAFFITAEELEDARKPSSETEDFCKRLEIIVKGGRE